MCGSCLIYHTHEKYSQHPRGVLLHTVTQRPRPTGSLPFPAPRFQACHGVSIQPADAGKEEARIPTGQSVSQPWTCRVSPTRIPWPELDARSHQAARQAGKRMGPGAGRKGRRIGQTRQLPLMRQSPPSTVRAEHRGAPDPTQPTCPTSTRGEW